MEGDIFLCSMVKTKQRKWTETTYREASLALSLEGRAKAERQSREGGMLQSGNTDKSKKKMRS